MADNKKISELQRATPEGIFDFIIASGDDNYKVNYTSVAEHSSIGTKSGIFTNDLTISGTTVSTGSHWLSYNNAGVGVNKTVPAYTLEVGGDLNVWGNIYTGGKLFDVEAEVLAIKGNLITINSGEQGQGVTRTIAGLLIDRGTYPSGSFLFNEGYDGFSASHNLVVTGGRHLGIGTTTPSYALHMTSGQLVGLTGAFSDQLTISGENVSTGVSPTDISDLSSRLISTGSNLDAYIDSVSGSLDLVSGKVDTVSGHVVGIQTTGLAPETGHFSKELTISGVAVSTGKGIDERLDVLSGHLITTGANLSGNIESLSGDLVATGTHLHDHIIEVSGDLITTGQFLQSQISVNAAGVTAVATNLIATGSHLHDHIIEVSGNVDTVSGSVVGIQTTGLAPETGHFSKSLTISGVSVATGSPGTDPRVDVLSGHLISTGQTLLEDIGAVSGDLITTGANLSGRINTLSGVVVANFYTLSGNLNQTGQFLESEISTLSYDVSSLSGDLDGVSGVLNNDSLSSSPFPELIYYSGGKLNTSENLIFSQNGLGIKSGGQPAFAPAYTLHVNGNAYISGNLYTGGKLIDVTAESLSVSGNIITINSGEPGIGISKTIAGIAIDRGTLSSGTFLFSELYTGFSASHNLIVTGGRRLGIGTETPNYALHIGEGELYARTGTFTDSLTISGNSVATGITPWIYGPTGPPIEYSINYTGGNVGIGIDEPEATLHVSGGDLAVSDGSIIATTGTYSEALTISGAPVATGSSLNVEWLTHNLQAKYQTSYLRAADVVVGDYFASQAPNASGQLSINKISDSSASIHLVEKNNEFSSLTSDGWTGYLYWGTGDGAICSLTVANIGAPWDGRYDLQPDLHNGKGHYKQYSSADRNLWWNSTDSRWVITAALGDPTAFYTLGAEPWTSQWLNSVGNATPLTVSSCSYTDIWDSYAQFQEFTGDGGPSIFYHAADSLTADNNYYFNTRFISGNTYAAPTHSKWIFPSSPTLTQKMSGLGGDLLSFDSIRGGNLSGVESGAFEKSLTISGISVATGAAGDLGKWSDGSTPGSIYYDGGDVGISNAAPQTALHVSGGLTLSNNGSGGLGGDLMVTGIPDATTSGYTWVNNVGENHAFLNLRVWPEAVGGSRSSVDSCKFVWGQTDEGTSDYEDWDEWGHGLVVRNTETELHSRDSVCYYTDAHAMDAGYLYYYRSLYWINGGSQPVWSEVKTFHTASTGTICVPYFSDPRGLSIWDTTQSYRTGNLYAQGFNYDAVHYVLNEWRGSSLNLFARLGIGSQKEVKAKLHVSGNNHDSCPTALFEHGNVGVGVQDPSGQLTVSGSAIISGSALFYLDYDLLPKSEPPEKGRIWIDSASDNVLKVAVGAGGVISTQWFELVGDSLKLRDTAYDSSNPAIEFWEAAGNGAYRPAAPGQTTSSAVAYFELNSQGDVQPTLNP